MDAIAGKRTTALPAGSGDLRRLTVLLLSGVFAVHFLDRQLLAILITPIKAEFGLSDTALGLLSGFAFAVLFSAVALVVARVADSVDRARIISASLAFFSVATALCGLAQTFWQLAIARLAVGLGEGGTNPASHAIIADLYPSHQRAAAMAIYSAGPHLGLLLAFGAGGALAQLVGWRATFLVVGGIGLLLSGITGMALREPRLAWQQQRPRVHLSAVEVLRPLLLTPSLRHLVLGVTLASAAAVAATTWMPALLMRLYGMKLAGTGIFLGLSFGVVGALVTAAFGRLADLVSRKYEARKGLITAAWQLLLALLWLPAILATERHVVLAAAVAPCAMIGAYLGPALAMVQDRVDARARAFSAAALLVAINLVGATAGPLVVGGLSDRLAATGHDRGLALALLAVPVLIIWSAVHFMLAARSSARTT